jgi:hypothetical protein
MLLILFLRFTYFTFVVTLFGTDIIFRNILTKGKLLYKN